MISAFGVNHGPETVSKALFKLPKIPRRCAGNCQHLERITLGERAMSMHRAENITNAIEAGHPAHEINRAIKAGGQ